MRTAGLHHRWQEAESDGKGPRIMSPRVARSDTPFSAMTYLLKLLEISLIVLLAGNQAFKTRVQWF